MTSTLTMCSKHSWPNIKDVKRQAVTDDARQSDSALKSENGNWQQNSINKQSNRRCYECNSSFHIRRFCPKLKGDHAAKPVLEAENKKDDCAFIIFHDRPQDARWLIDFGATSHMTHNRDLFKTNRTLEKPQKVNLGNGHFLEVVGIGNVEVFTQSGSKFKPNTVCDVLHVPQMTANLFSVRSAADKSIIVQFGHSRCWLKNNQGKICATGKIHYKLYYLDTTDDTVYHCSTTANDNNIWHQCLEYASKASIQTAHQNRWVIGADLCNVNFDLCEPCIKSKMTWKPFLSHGIVKTTKPHEVVHTDVCGTLQTESLGGSKFFVSFIDDFIRYAFMYFVCQKSDVFEKFREFGIFFTNKPGISIGALQSDCGGEYVNAKFEQYLVSKGIHHQLTVRYSPEQNGVAKRFNRTVCESVRAMIIDSDLLKTFWTEAIATATYARNRLPTKAIWTTPHECWFGCKPNISHLKVFGCIAYSHLPAALCQKLDSKAERITFVGCSSRSKGYRLYDPISIKLVTRGDVIFDEAKLGPGVVNKSDKITPSKIEMHIDSPLSSTSNTWSVEPVLSRSSRTHHPPVRYDIDKYVGAFHGACHALGIIEPRILLML